jgi:D-sedoheptulose 7-phosphate isomerase
MKSVQAEPLACPQAPEPAAFDIITFLQGELAEHRHVFEATQATVGSSFVSALDLIETSIRCGGKLLTFGNGGSAADAQHIASELVIRYMEHRRPIAAIALTTDTSALTACGNDLGFDALFARQVHALGRSGDVAMGISTSGSSPNVIEGLLQARRDGMRTIGMTGGSGGKMTELCDAVIAVPSRITARIQEMHILIGHMLCKALEKRLGLV